MLPKPRLVGEGQKVADASKPELDPKPGPLLKHEPTLIGLPKHLPTASLAVQPGTPPKGKSESSLVGLSLKVQRSPRAKTGTRLKAPAGPPNSRQTPANDAGPLAPKSPKPHAGDPTDYNIEVLGAYITPPLPSRLDSETIDLSGSTDVWEEPAADEAYPGAFKRSKRSTILTAAALFAVAALGLGVCAYASNGQVEKASRPAAIGALHDSPKAAGPLAEAQPEKDESSPLGASVATAASAPALSAELIAPKSSMTKGKAKLSKRAKARRLRALQRANKRKSRHAHASASLDSTKTIR